MMSSWCILWSVVSIHFIPLATRARASTTAAVLQKLTKSHLLVKLYVWCHPTNVKAVRTRNGAHERLHDFHGGISPEQAHGVIHDRSITGQRDPPIVDASEAKLLLRHPQELAKDLRAKVRQWHLKPCSVSSVHHTVTLHRHRRCRATLIVCFPPGLCRGPDEPLPPDGRHCLPLLCHLSKSLGTNHVFFSLLLLVSWLGIVVLLYLVLCG